MEEIKACSVKKLEDVIREADKYIRIKDVVFGYNLDENIYDKYQRVVKIVAEE